ncbi:MAG: filamentous hemagglutinin N-terminal domain-containing protein [Gallionella sp.]|nr:filamentous hemagglutinin N-terminal domain-containing protein [Gallionella sp.]
MKIKSTIRSWPYILLAAILWALSGQVQALPTGQAVSHGSAIFAPGTNSLAITAGAPRTVITWSGFDVAANESVSFNQNSLGTGGNADILNIVSGAASNILGAISAGTAGIRVYIVNPNGFVLNAPAAGTSTGNALATGVASSINFSNVSVQPSAFNGSGGNIMTSLQHVVPQFSTISSMSGINIPAAGGAAVTVPTGATVVNGAASISNPAANFVSVHVTAPDTIIDWATFDLAGGSTVRFTSNDPSVAPGSPTSLVYNILNRITSGAVSSINGTIDVFSEPLIGGPAMNVFIMNPNGVVLGGSGNVQTNFATVTLSGAATSNQAFISGTLPTGVIYPNGATLYANAGGTNTGGNGGTGAGNQGNEQPADAQGLLPGAVPRLANYVDLLTVAQAAVLAQLQNYFSQDPVASQQAANAMTQSVPQAMSQTQAVVLKATQRPVTSSSMPFVVRRDASGMQSFLFVNSLRASVRNGVVNLRGI